MVLCIHCVWRSVNLAARRLLARIQPDEGNPWGEWVVVITPAEGDHCYTAKYEGRRSDGEDIARRKIVALAFATGRVVGGHYEIISPEEFERRCAHWHRAGELDSAGRPVNRPPSN